MQTTTTIVIGAGHAGLAMSKCLTDCSIEHIVLERGKVAHTWRTERWDSLTLLTPNWQSRLPGYGYQGDDPDGYRSLPETIAFIERYASLIAAPVQTHTNVNSVKKSEHGYLVSTDKGDWQCRSVVLASGACNLPNIPKFADDLPSTVRTLTPATYRNPE
ncbi:MAG: pyridine nucleotide-disulfide oxidoreductase, partial [Zetaproteobacteria bacterium CG02_land_8_20_14_3_00_50_9]